MVVDNGSTDGSQQLDVEFPHVRFSKLPKNFGLTKALNIGTRASDGEFILLLHDDVTIGGGAVTQLADYLAAHSEAGAVCPLLLNPDGSEAPQVCSLPAPAGPDFVARSVPSGVPEVAVECVNGAAIMMRTSFLRNLRHIDERFGTFGSAAELSMQVRRANRKLVILRDVTAVHGREESPVSPSLLAGDRIAGTAAFLGKHYGAAAATMYRLKKGLASLVTFRFRSVMGAFGGVKIDGTN